MFLAVLLTLHSWTRWAVVASLVVVVARSVRAWATRRPWTPPDATVARAWVGAMDLQLALGFTLYFVGSPMAEIARHDLRAAWAAGHALRFFGLIHPACMFVAFMLTHATWISARRTELDRERFRRLALGSLVTSVLVAVAIPWPFLSYGRPLVRP
ncbi:MAG: hypothetical protein KF850_24670 [Labilithrix sp.]|nr:hypothetical protein [Labilithrix sp.]MBX3215252.1 hypothetical protein [Labilithrix sp.]